MCLVRMRSYWTRLGIILSINPGMGVLIRRPCEHTEEQTLKAESHVKTEAGSGTLF